MTQLDNLFKNKLEHHSKPAPAPAWNRIEAALDKPAHGALWMKIAAGLFVGAVATFLLWPAQPTSTSTVAAVENPALSAPATVPASPAETSQPVTSTEAITTAPAHSATQTQQPAKREIQPTQPPVVLPQETPVTLAQETTVNTPQYATETSLTAPETITPEVSRAVVITYSAAEVNERFLKKNLVDATSEEKKQSGIQKLLTLAADIKNTSNGLGDLREKKNEILALNFHDDKRGQNK